MVKDNWGNREMKVRKNRYGIPMVTLSIAMPIGILEQIEELADIERYWSSRNEVIRSLIKTGLKREQERLMEFDNITDAEKSA